jgi:vitamin B12 transporter
MNAIPNSMNKLVIGLCVYACASAVVQAQVQDSLPSTQLKEVVVSDTKFALNSQKSGKIIEVITAQDLAKKQGQSLANVLSQLAGVEINGNQSFAGKNLGYYLRGGRNRQTAIYIDGIPVTDASGINLEYDLRLLSIDQIEKIEVMKGASSTLYGTGAATGVISITLKKSTQKQLAGSVYASIGTQNTAQNLTMAGQEFNQGFSVNGTIQKVNYLTAVSCTETRGLSEAAGNATEADVFSRWNIRQKLGFKASERLRFELFGNYDRIKNTFDNSFDGTPANADDLNNASFSEQYRLGLGSTYSSAFGEFAMNAGLSSIDRTIWQTNSATADERYTGRTASFDLFAKHKFSNQLFLVSGLQYQFLDMSQKDLYSDVQQQAAKFVLLDPYATLVYNADFGLNINAGSRFNTHSAYGNQVVFNVNPSYVFAQLPLKLLASHSTAFITPSLYQLYGPYGNVQLTPERNATTELGFESRLWAKKMLVKAVGFYREESNAIGFYYNPDTFESFYINVLGGTHAKGLEGSVRYACTANWNLGANYTYTEVEQQLNRLIPKHKVNMELSYQFKKGSAGLTYQYVHSRSDAYYDSNTFESALVQLPAYQVVNSTVAWDIMPKRLQIFGSITNLLNADFQEVIGYNAKGRNAKLGFSFLF